MNSMKLLALFVAGGMILLHAACRAQAESPADKLFSMALRLESSGPWTANDIGKIAEITGRTLIAHGYTSYQSEDSPDDKLMRQVEVEKDPSRGLLTGVSLELPRQGLGISRSLVLAKFGKCSYIEPREIWGSMKLDGFHAVVRCVCRRKNGGSLVFYFDDDKTKQLRMLDVIP